MKRIIFKILVLSYVLGNLFSCGPVPCPKGIYGGMEKNIYPNCKVEKDYSSFWIIALIGGQSSTSGETATVEVSGIAKDSSGNIISNGTVSVSESNSSSMKSRATVTTTTTTDGSGNFTVYLKVAKFKITVKNSGGTEIGSFELNITSTTEANISPTNVIGLTVTLTSAKPVNGDTDLLAGGLSSVSGTIYIAGYSMNSSGVGVAGYWKNGVWNALPPIDVTKGSGAKSIVVSGSDVYVSGSSANSSGVYVAGYWKNGVWNALPSIDATQPSRAGCIVITR